MIQEASNERAPLVPLEANPEALNRFLDLIGFDVQTYRFVDVFSTSDQDLLNLVPRPVLGVLLVKPSSSSDKNNSKNKNDHCSANPAKIWHMPQTTGGSCGSLAVLHLIVNLISNNASVPGPICQPNSWLEGFLSGDKTDLDEQFCRLHNQAACHQSNQTSHTTVTPGKRVGTTYSALMPIKAHDGDDRGTMVLVELDGRSQGPIVHESVSSTTFLEDSCRWIEHNVMKNQPHGKFAILALAANKSNDE